MPKKQSYFLKSQGRNKYPVSAEKAGLASKRWYQRIRASCLAKWTHFHNAGDATCLKPRPWSHHNSSVNWLSRCTSGLLSNTHSLFSIKLSSEICRLSHYQSHIYNINCDSFPISLLFSNFMPGPTGRDIPFHSSKMYCKGLETILEPCVSTIPICRVDTSYVTIVAL